MIDFKDDAQNQKLAELRKSEEEDLAQLLARRYGFQYVNLGPMPINVDALRLLTEEEAKAAKMATFGMVGRKVQVAVVSPQNEKAKVAVEALIQKGYVPTVYIASTESMQKAWERYKDLSYATESHAGALEISSQALSDYISTVSTLADVQKNITEVMQLKRAARISKILESVLGGALALKASDVHMEPQETDVRLRFRLDGVLTDIMNFDNETYSLLLSRVKLLSGLKLNVRAEAQDGRFSIKISVGDIEIRTSVLPGAYAESIVLRLLNPETTKVDVDSLGINPHLFAMIETEIRKPNGMLLTTGPTGSGKTTTLYSFLRRIHTPDIKIITIEDPIEYHLPGIVQTQTDSEKGYTFQAGLRAALRQDPDVIMVGEIRDEETAKIAVNSAQTGHLVFSTLHTNNAAGTFPRLIDLGINPKVISSAVNLALAQRLVRKLCPDCKKSVPLAGTQKELVDKVLASIVNRTYVEGVQTTNVFEPVGCEKCHGIGYKGRLGIYEGIKADRAVEAVLLTNPSEREVKLAAKPQGILDMRQDGIIKILQGTTSFEELSRVIDLEEEIL